MMPDIINDQNADQFISPIIDGDHRSRGLIPRNYGSHPVGYIPAAPPMPDEELIPESEWADRLAEQQATKSSLLDLRQQEYETLKSLDQDGYGYCWAFSTTKAVMYARTKAGQPRERLSAWGVAAIIKGYRDEGGWGAESLEWIVQNGIPSLDVWPQAQVKRALDTPQMRADAAKRKVTEWWDGSNNRELAKKQMVTAYLQGIPCVCDYNWWGHSVCGIAVVSLNPFRCAIDNSWGEKAGDKGIYILEGQKAIPDGLVIPRVSMGA
jgi:hypothetical protein